MITLLYQWEFDLNAVNKNRQCILKIKKHISKKSESSIKKNFFSGYRKSHIFQKIAHHEQILSFIKNLKINKLYNIDNLHSVTQLI